MDPLYQRYCCWEKLRTIGEGDWTSSAIYHRLVNTYRIIRNGARPDRVAGVFSKFGEHIIVLDNERFIRQEKEEQPTNMTWTHLTFTVKLLEEPKIPVIPKHTAGTQENHYRWSLGHRKKSLLYAVCCIR